MALHLSYFLCFLFIIIPSQVRAQICDNNRGNYTINSTYHNNLNFLLSSFSSHKEINYGFYNFSYGQGTDKVYAIGLCTGDQNQDDCLKCLSNSTASLAKKCPNQKEAIHWREKCLLRYSNRSMFGIVQNEPSQEIYLTTNVTGSVDEFNSVVQSWMTNLTRKAASGDSRRKYATGTTFGPNVQTINGQVQCMPDLSSEDCTNCLMESMAAIISCCSGHAGGTVLKPSCRFRFDPYTYYGPTLKLDPDAPSPTTPPPPPSLSNNKTFSSSASAGKRNTSRTTVAIAVPVASVVLALSLLCIYVILRKPRKKTESKCKALNIDFP